MGDRDPEVQAFSYKINKSWGCKEKHGEYSQKHCINSVWWQMLTRLNTGKSFSNAYKC